MRSLRVRDVDIKKELDVLVRPATLPPEYQNAMKTLGWFLGKDILKALSRKGEGLVVCTPEDADFLAAGAMEALRPFVKHLGLACFWHHRGRPAMARNVALDLDVAPVVKRYEETMPKLLDFVVIVKSIISTGCVIKHNILDILDRKQPTQIFIAAPVIYRGADSALKEEFPPQVSRKFRFIYFAKDDLRNDRGIVEPGIGGNVYQRLGLTQGKHATPGIVKSRRLQQTQETVAHSRPISR